MGILDELLGLIASARQSQPSRGGGAARPQGVRTQQQIQGAPFKMFEDQSFQGDPSQFRGANPGYKFYEDNTFARAQPRTQQEIQSSPFRMFEDDSFQGMPTQMAKQGANFYEDNTFSRFDTPANKFFPNRGNTGSQYDDMVDTSMGYLSPDQFNQGYRGQLQSRGFNPQQEYRNRLRVR